MCMFVLTDGECVYVCSLMVMVSVCVLTDGDGECVCAH